MSTTPHVSIKVAISVDFDAVAGWLGTGAHADNTLADYSSGFFSAHVGVPRLLKLFRRLGLSDKVTWFIPGHSMESFPRQTRDIVESGAEIGLHGYSHEGAAQLTETQERDVLLKCISLCTNLTGAAPQGYRAPLYSLRESTLQLLQTHNFVYDSSLSHHDSEPYFLPPDPVPIKPPSFSPSREASEWMHPLPGNVVQPDSTEDGNEERGSGSGKARRRLVEIPCNWYMEDMTPLQFWPHTPNSHGYVDVRVVERMWMDRFEFLREDVRERWEESGEDRQMQGQGQREEMVVFPLVLHPDTSGMAHVIRMVERVLKWLQGWGDEVEFCTMVEIARGWRERHGALETS